MTKLRLVGLSLALVCGSSLSACEDEGGECDAAQLDRVDMVIALTPDDAAGAGTFANYCGSSACHGTNGDSGPAPNLSREVGERDDTELLCLILNGSGGMPAQEGLTDQQLADLLAYARATF
jgi:mono/diheme cytochrome c family protein